MRKFLCSVCLLAFISSCSLNGQFDVRHIHGYAITLPALWLIKKANEVSYENQYPHVVWQTDVGTLDDMVNEVVLQSEGELSPLVGGTETHKLSMEIIRSYTTQDSIGYLIQPSRGGQFVVVARFTPNRSGVEVAMALYKPETGPFTMRETNINLLNGLWNFYWDLMEASEVRGIKDITFVE